MFSISSISDLHTVKYGCVDALTCFGVLHRRLPQSPLTVRMRMVPPSHPREANRRRLQVRRWSTILWSCPGVICTDPPQQRSWTSWRRQKACFTAVCSKCRWGSFSCPHDDMQTAGYAFTHSPHMSVTSLRQQMEELLKEVALSERRKQKIDSFIKMLTKLLQKVPETPEVEVCSSLKKNLKKCSTVSHGVTFWQFHS